MVTNRLQESSSPKQAPVAADSTNGTLLRFQEQCGRRCHLPAMADGENAVGPLVLTLGVPTAADDACRRDADAPAQVPAMLPSVLLGSRYLRPTQELLRDAVSVGAEVADDENEGGYDDETGDEAYQEMLASSRSLHGKNNDGVQAKLLSLLSEVRTIPLQNR
jgi:hypothetical protein